MLNLTTKFIVGILAGFAAWAINEPSNPGMSPAFESFEVRLTMLLAVFIGGAVGAMNGWQQGSKLHAVRGLVLGVIFGVVGSGIGANIGSGLAHGLFQGNVQSMIPRIIALTPMGAGLGLGIGASTLSARRAVQGLIGGAMGAALGAAVFDAVGEVMAAPQLTLDNVRSGQVGEVGAMPRAIFASAMGGGIALFIGLVDLLARSAWLRLNLGRNEGKDYSLDWAENTIGRSERATVPLFGDPNIAPIHAVIRKEGPNYVLHDAGTPMGTGVNGQRIQAAVLHPGDIVQVGAFALDFMIRNQPAPRRVVDPRINPQGYSPIPVPSTAPNLAATPAMGSLQPTVAAVTMGALVVLDGPSTGARIPVLGPFELGRESQMANMAGDTMASRRHASISQVNGSLTVTDLGSTNGTFVNGNRVQTSVLRPGDEVRIGSTRFRVE